MSSPILYVYQTKTIFLACTLESVIRIGTQGHEWGAELAGLLGEGQKEVEDVDEWKKEVQLTSRRSEYLVPASGVLSLSVLWDS